MLGQSVNTKASPAATATAAAAVAGKKHSVREAEVHAIQAKLAAMTPQKRETYVKGLMATSNKCRGADPASLTKADRAALRELALLSLITRLANKLPATAAQSKASARVVLPEGVRPGQKLRVRLPNNVLVAFTVPEGAVAGQTIEVSSGSAAGENKPPPAGSSSISSSSTTTTSSTTSSGSTTTSNRGGRGQTSSVFTRAGGERRLRKGDATFAEIQKRLEGKLETMSMEDRGTYVEQLAEQVEGIQKRATAFIEAAAKDLPKPPQPPRVGRSEETGAQARAAMDTITAKVKKDRENEFWDSLSDADTMTVAELEVLLTLLRVAGGGAGGGGGKMSSQ